MNENGTSIALVNADTGEVVARDAGWWERGDLVALAADQFMPGATAGEFGLFLETARALGLSPFARQIFAVQRWDNQAKRQKWVHQVSIDGFRLVAARTGAYQGQTPRQWCGPDGAWRDVWLEDGPPAAARVGVYHRDFREPLYGVATYREYVQTSKDGSPNAMWRSKPALMVAKCAEALALRAAFPAELSGVYSDDEMGQASVGHVEVEPTPAAPPRTVDDVARECGVGEHVLRAWWCRDRADEKLTDADVAKIVRMTPAQVGRMCEAVAGWYMGVSEAAILADADAMVAAGDATDEDAPPPKRRGRKAEAQPVIDVDPIDEEIAAAPPQPPTVVAAEDDIPF